MSRLAIVTCTLDTERALSCFNSWRDRSAQPIDYYVVEQEARNRDWERVDQSKYGQLFRMETREILGVVPAFALGVQKALEDGAEVIACLHDDLEIEQDGWDEDVVRLFKACPRAGLLGFGGGKGLGSDDIYKSPYNPMQLARQRFISNMRHAEAHGIRSEVAEPVACLDGFSQIGLASFWEGWYHDTHHRERLTLGNLFGLMARWGVNHHFYDGMLGCFAKRLGYQVWYLPIRCHHYGGRTAVADERYLQWANAQSDDPDTAGDQMFWIRSHEIGAKEFKDVLPIRT